MPRTGGWRREGTRRPFRYVDVQGHRIQDAETLARLEALAIPPAWRDVWISTNARSKLQATGVDKAGRRQYLYHPEFRAQQEQLKYVKLIRFAEKLPELRLAMGEHIMLDPLDPNRVCAIAVRLINLAWFRVGGDRYAKSSQTYGVTTLQKSHVDVRGKRITFRYPGKHSVQVRTALIDGELAEAIAQLLELPGGRLFRYAANEGLYNLTDRRLNEYVKEHMGPEFSGKDFRTWGGTLLAAIAFAERGPVQGAGAQRKAIAAVTRSVAEKLGNTPAVTRASYISPAVIEQYLDGRTIEDFRPRHLRIVTARDIGLDPEEQGTLSLLRSWRIRDARKAA